MCSRPSLPSRADPFPSRVSSRRRAHLGGQRGAASGRGVLAALPRRVAAIPQLSALTETGNEEPFSSPRRRAADLNDPDESNGSSESASLVVLLDALAEARAVADELEAVLEKAKRAARATDREPRRSFRDSKSAPLRTSTNPRSSV